MGDMPVRGAAVVGQSQVVLWTPTISSGSAYSSGDAVGTAIQLPGCFRENRIGITSIIQSLVISDGTAQNAAMSLLLFASQPAGTYTDNDAIAVTAADAKLVVARIPIAAASYVTVGGTSTFTSGNLGLIVESRAASDSLWAALQTTSTPTYDATTALQLQLGILWD